MRTWIRDSERVYLAAQIPEEFWVSPESSQVSAPDERHVFIFGGDGSTCLLDGRAFVIRHNGRSAPLYVEYSNGQEVGLYETDVTFPTIADLEEQPS